uniref:Uncharacterized protein n=1 Tax=Globodera rostochiensis TaxID=31243 RepID=A0A914I1K2_GLORO
MQPNKLKFIQRLLIHTAQDDAIFFRTTEQRVIMSAPLIMPIIYGKKHCFCGIPVQTAARVIAIVNIAFCALGIVLAIYAYGPSTMMTALKWRNPKLYLPYLAVKGFFTLLGCLFAVFTLCLTIYVLITEGISKRGIMGIAACAVNCVFVPFCIWLYRLVWLAYKEAAGCIKSFAVGFSAEVLGEMSLPFGFSFSNPSLQTILVKADEPAVLNTNRSTSFAQWNEFELEMGISMEVNMVKMKFADLLIASAPSNLSEWKKYWQRFF